MDVSFGTPVTISGGLSQDVSTTNSLVDDQPSLQVQEVSSEVDLKPHDSPLPAVVSSTTLPVPEGRIFLDICAGVTRPLSQAVLDLGGQRIII